LVGLVAWSTWSTWLVWWFGGLVVWWFGELEIMFFEKNGFCSVKNSSKVAKSVLFKKQYLSTAMSLLTK
jgi:hypothetical protein